MNKFSLNNHKKIESGFNAPEGYFDNLSDSIMSVVHETPSKKDRVFTLRNFSYAAAAVLILALGIPFFLNNTISSIEQIDDVSLENYLSNQSNISSYDLINIMEIDEIDEIQVDLALEDESIEEHLINNPNLEHYLND